MFTTTTILHDSEAVISVSAFIDFSSEDAAGGIDANVTSERVCCMKLGRAVVAFLRRKLCPVVHCVIEMSRLSKHACVEVAAHDIKIKYRFMASLSSSHRPDASSRPKHSNLAATQTI